MSIKLKDLKVRCYRGIRELVLDDFNHVNILVGDNNAGKTSVMEMITALNSPLSLMVWNEIASKKSDNYRGIRYYSAYNNIFPIDKEKKISFSGNFADYGNMSVSMSATEDTTTISERELNRINGFIRTGHQDDEETYVSARRLEVLLEANLEQENFEVYDFQRRPPRIGNHAPRKIVINENTVFIEPRDGLENDFSYMNKVLLDSSYHAQLVEILQEFDASISDILSIEEMGRPVYYVRTSNHDNAIPISVYGDGLKKALIIFAMLASNKGGIVLIDEVESSMHTSAMNKIFNMIVSWARKLDIQLFLSTHSEEALNILLNCNEQFQSGVTVYTLYCNNQKNYVRRLECLQALELHNKMGMELR